MEYYLLRQSFFKINRADLLFVANCIIHEDYTLFAMLIDLSLCPYELKELFFDIPLDQRKGEKQVCYLWNCPVPNGPIFGLNLKEFSIRCGIQPEQRGVLLNSTARLIARDGYVARVRYAEKYMPVVAAQPTNAMSVQQWADWAWFGPRAQAT